jgi:hypothetical protein
MPKPDPLPLSLWRGARRPLRRAFTWDLLSVEVTEGERAQLLAAGVTQEAVQRYAVWRRSALVVVLVPTLLAALLATVNTASQGIEGLSRAGRLLTLLSTLVLWAMPVSAFLARWWWVSLRRSHHLVIAGWVAAFLPPFLIALVPLGWWFEAAGPHQDHPAGNLELAVLDAVNGLHVAFTLLPTALAILPGLVRACVRVKLLLPAAILPGWFLMVVPPFYVLLWIVALIPLNHLAGSPLLVLGVLLLVGAPLLYVWRADLFVRPLRPDQCGGINRVRQGTRVVSAVGSVLLLAYLFTRQVFGLHLVGLDAQSSLLWLWENRDLVPIAPGEALQEARSLYWLGDIRLSGLVVQYFGRSLFMTTVFAGLLVRMNLSAWAQEKHFAGAPGAAAYGEAMAELKQVLG